MPYEIETRRRGKTKRKVYVVKNSDTGHVKGTHSNRKDAESQISLLRGIKHGWTPTKTRK